MDENILQVGDFDRTQVLLLGDFPVDDKPFIERNLTLTKITFVEAKDHFATAKAILIAEHPSKYSLIKKCFGELFPEADNYGIMLKVLVDNEKDMQILNGMFGADNLIKHFHFRKESIEVTEKIARYSPGPPPNLSNHFFKNKVSELDEEDKMLLRRSFHNCKKIYIDPIKGGKNSKHLLKVYAWMGNSEVEAAMLPFFMKIAIHEEIKNELENYRVITADYISFQYRPNCRIERHVRTRNYSSLVGNFVDEAIPLRKALQNSHPSGIIHALFEKSLRGFRRRALRTKKAAAKKTFREFVEGRIKIYELLNQHELIEKAKEFGLKSDVEQLSYNLLDVCTEACRTGVIHGDLHVGNVMVSGNDAIIIDFSAIKTSGPLTADPATLEISLCFDCGEKPLKFNKWKKFVDEAYEPTRIKKPLPFTDQIPNEFFWLRRAVREVRHILIGCDHCESEIEAILACYLMRIARLKAKNHEEFKYRAYALVLAERIINFLQEKRTLKHHVNKNRQNIL